MDIDKFVEKNYDEYEEMEQVFSSPTTKIRYIVISPELDAYLKDDTWRKNYSVLINPYQPPANLEMITNVSGMDLVKIIKFNLPCICGVYGDEKHK